MSARVSLPKAISTVSRRRAWWARTTLGLGSVLLLGAAGVGIAQTAAVSAPGTGPSPTHAATVTPVGGALARTVSNPVPTPAAAPSPGHPGVRLLNSYQMRCWQDGQLVLDEPLAQAPADGAPASIRLQGTQAAGTAVMLLSAGTATCLVRPARER